MDEIEDFEDVAKLRREHEAQQRAAARFHAMTVDEGTQAQARAIVDGIFAREI